MEIRGKRKNSFSLHAYKLRFEPVEMCHNTLFIINRSDEGENTDSVVHKSIASYFRRLSRRRENNK